MKGRRWFVARHRAQHRRFAEILEAVGVEPVARRRSEGPYARQWWGERLPTAAGVVLLGVQVELAPDTGEVRVRVWGRSDEDSWWLRTAAVGTVTIEKRQSGVVLRTYAYSRIVPAAHIAENVSRWIDEVRGIKELS